jgi:hypothetical protein
MKIKKRMLMFDPILTFLFREMEERMLDGLVDGANRYFNRLPNNIPSSALSSGLYTFFVSAVISKNLNSGLFCAALASAVSIISALTMPIFKDSLSDANGNMRWYEQAVHSVAILGISQILISFGMSYVPQIAYKVNLFAGALSTVALNLLLNQFKNRPTSESAPYILIGELGNLV